MTRIATARVDAERLLLSPAPAAEVAAAALEAQQSAGIEHADFVVVAVDRGSGAETERRVADALELGPAVDPDR